MSIKTARHLLERLGIDDTEEIRNYLIGSLPETSGTAEPEYHEMALEQAEMVAGWQHLAILAALDISNFRATVKTLAQRLGIPFAIAVECVQRLRVLGFVEVDANGQVRKLAKNYATPSHVPSDKLRQGHRQFIEKALVAMDEIPVARRNISGITMAVNSKRIEEAQIRIQRFRRELSDFLEQGPRDSVFRLNIQLFPVDKATT